jgi:hypothetical protein
MAAAALRHYTASLSTTSATTVVPAVATARALVIGKILIAATGTSTIAVTVGGVPIISGMSLNAGQVYTETGLLLCATETLTCTAGTASMIAVSVYGEEVDN